MLIFIPVSVIVLVLVVEYWRQRAYRAEGRCNVCYGTETPICDVCGRCKDANCNAGCIYCRKGIQLGPFGSTEVRATSR